MGGKALGGDGIVPGFVVAKPTLPLGHLSHERLRLALYFDRTDVCFSSVLFLQNAFRKLTPSLNTTGVPQRTAGGPTASRVGSHRGSLS